MKKRLLSLALTLVMLLGLLPAAAGAAETEETPMGEEAVAAPAAEKTSAPAELAEVTTDLTQWLNEGARELLVCGVKVTPDNARDILADTAYSGCGRAEFGLYAQGDAVKPTLRLTDLSVEDNNLSNIIKYTGSGLESSDLGRFQSDILYVRVWNSSGEASTFKTTARNAVDIRVTDASLDLSGFSGSPLDKLNLNGNQATNLDVRNGDLHIHDIILTAIGSDDGGIQVYNGTLTVSGADTEVTSDEGRFGTAPVTNLASEAEQLTPEDILVLNDGLAITAPRGAKAVLERLDKNPDYGYNYYRYSVGIVDESDDSISDPMVIKQPHTHAVDGADVTFDHTMASYVREITDGDSGEVMRTLYLELDGELWYSWNADVGAVTKNDLPAGSYLLTDNIDFDKGLKVNAGTVNLCLDGKKLAAGGDVTVKGGAKLTVSDCSEDETGSIENKGTACEVSATWSGGSQILGELLLESGTIQNTMTKAEGEADSADNNNNTNRAIYNGGYVTLRGGTVSGPYGVHLQYGFYGDAEAYTKSPIILEGAPKLDCSIADVHLILDLYTVDKITHPMIDATGYTGTDSITIAVENNSADAPLSDKLGTPIVKLGATPADKFTLLSEGCCLEKKTVNGETCLVLAAQPAHSHAVSADCSATEGEQVTFTEWDTATALPATAGNYVLTGDVTFSNKWSVPEGTTNLCLNGHTVTCVSIDSSPSAISVPEGAALNLCDCAATVGTIDGTGKTYTIRTVGELSLYGGTLDGGSTVAGIGKGGVFRMHGGSVKGKSDSATGVHVEDDGAFFMDGGTITGNAMGVVVEGDGVFRAEGNVVIHGNTSSSGSPRNVVMHSKSDYTDDGQQTYIPVPMELSGPLGANAKLGLSLYQWFYMEKVSPFLAVQGYDGYAVTAGDFAKLSSDKPGDYPLKLTGGEVYFTPPDPGHTHSWAAAWSKNDTHHWHECTAQGCDVTQNSGKDGCAEHTKTWVSTDAAQHWQTCATCGWTGEKTAHTWNAGVVTTPPTVDAEGVKTYTCTACQAAKTGAVPKLEPTYSVSGAVTDHTGGRVSGAAVTLTRGKTEIASTTTDSEGNYSFSGVPAGTYNVAAEKDGVTKTILVELSGADAAEQNIQMPEGKTNSVVEVKGENTPAVVVGGVDRIAESESPGAGETVTVKLTVEQKAAEAADNAAEIKSVAGKQTLDFLELKLEKTVTDGTNSETTTEITDTRGAVIEIVVPYDFTNKKEVTVYRYHDGRAEALAPAQGDAKKGGTFRLDTAGGLIHIYATKFSTYAIGYTEEGATPVIPPSRPSTPATYYTLTAAAGQGGAISPSGRVSVRRNGTKTFTITPDEGYAVADVLVDGKSVGAVTEYTFEKITANHTIAAGFQEHGTGCKTCPKDDTCPIAKFTDADAAAWYHDGVHYCIENGLMNGYGSGKLGPNDNLSRAQFAQLLFNKEGRPVVDDLLQFEDVPNGAWYTEAIRWATSQGIVSGYGNGKFGPDDNITREQLAVMLWRHAGSPAATDKELHFSDADKASGFALDALRWAVEQGILTGKGGGKLDPAGQATRAEAAAMLQRYLVR